MGSRRRHLVIDSFTSCHYSCLGIEAFYTPNGTGAPLPAKRRRTDRSLKRDPKTPHRGSMVKKGVKERESVNDSTDYRRFEPGHFFASPSVNIADPRDFEIPYLSSTSCSYLADSCCCNS